MINLEITHDKSLEAIRQVGHYIKDQFEQFNTIEIEEKEHNSLVSIVDKTAEKMLVNQLIGLIPDAGFLTEEKIIDNAKSEYTWIIDPLDGTTNFLNGIPVFSVSVALMNHDDIILGYVYDVMQDDMYHAKKKGGAYRNEEKITVTQKPLSDCLIATGFPYTNDYPIDDHMERLKYWLLNTRGVRRMGSAAIDLAYVAAGKFGAYYEGFLNIWDVAAGILIAQEAGAKVTDYHGDDDYLAGTVIAATPKNHDEVLAIIKDNRSHLNKIEHLGIAVKDLDEAEAIYTKILGYKPYKREEVKSEHVMTSFLKCGPNKIELLAATSEESAIHKYLEKNRPGLHHVAFAVEDIHAEMKRLKDLDFRILNPEPKKGADNKIICFVHPKSTGGLLMELCQDIK